MAADADLLAEQRAYYRARAPEYDDWWYRRGRYDTGAEEHAAWREEISWLVAELAGLGWDARGEHRPRGAP